jgi:hypothetical protein
MPPSDSRFAPWTMVRSEDGTIYYAAGAWLDEKHAPTTAPAALATGSPTIADVPDPEGTLEHTGKTIHGTNDADGGAGLDAPANGPSPDNEDDEATDAAAEAGLPP